MVAPTTGALAPYRGPGTDSPELHLVGNVIFERAKKCSKRQKHHITCFSLRCGPRDAVIGDGVGTPSDFLKAGVRATKINLLRSPASKCSVSNSHDSICIRVGIRNFIPKRQYTNVVGHFLNHSWGYFCGGRPPRIPRLGGTRPPRPPRFRRP